MCSDAEIKSTKERRKSMMCTRPTRSTVEMKTHIIRYKLNSVEILLAKDYSEFEN